MLRRLRITEYDFFSTKQLHLLILCTFSKFGESGFGESGRHRKNWVDVIKRDLRQMDLTWEEAEELANDKAECRRRVAQYSHLDAG